MKSIFLIFLLFFISCSNEINDVSRGTKEICEFDNCNNDCNCGNEYEPVCGVNNVTYGNKCLISCDKIDIQYDGECK